MCYFCNEQFPEEQLQVKQIVDIYFLKNLDEDLPQKKIEITLLFILIFIIFALLSENDKFESSKLYINLIL